MEQLELADPETEVKTTSHYRVISLHLDWELTILAGGEPGVVFIQLRDNNGELFSHKYLGNEATDMMKWMNTANFSVNSMHKRILQKLSNDGVLPGTVTGSPDPPATVEF